MKRLVYVILIVFIVSVSAQAQFSAGLKAGFNMSTMTVDDDAGDYGYAPGYQIGGFLDYSLTKISVQVDVVYSKQGATIKTDGEELEAISKYVNIPITVKYKVIPTVNLQLGPQIGFLTCMESDFHPVVSMPFQEQDYTKAYKKTDFGVNVGAGWESPIGIIVDVRYYLGLTEINDYEGLEPTKNSMVHITVGYKIFKF